MKEIKLTQGKIAIVDDEDFEMLSKYKWYTLAANCTNRTFYAVRTSQKRPVYMHRMIVGAKKGDPLLVDHVNHNGLDNRKSNLRVCSSVENQGNRIGTTNCACPYKGVTFHQNRFRARISLNGKSTYIGSFDLPCLAAKAYDKKAKELFGEFAYLNFPEREAI